ncbi:MAG TPA: serine hydrolase domain-containing protein [Candidatus Binatia bacterium]|nr:serine hydrolase domain-containing protein [Candidatus Binatia bacterium]
MPTLEGDIISRFLLGTTLLVALGACQTNPQQEPQSSQTSQRGIPEVRPRTIETQLQALLDHFLTAHTDVPGVSLHVEAPRLSLSWSGAAGVADRTSGARLTSANPFRIASITKTYTAAATLRLVEDGKLTLDDPIARHLPSEFVETLAAGDYDSQVITIRHLLTHTGGLYDYATDAMFHHAVGLQPNKRWTRLEQVRFAVDHGRPYGRPGETFHYADTGYLLLGEIIERKAFLALGVAFRQLLNYDALGLTSTWLETVELAPSGVANRAHQYLGDTDTYTWDPSFDLFGGGGLVATARDLTRFQRGLFTGKVYRKPETLEVMLSTVVAPDQGMYRVGIFFFDVDGVQGWGHKGSWNTWSYYFPALDVAIAGAILQQNVNPGDLLKNVFETIKDAAAENN